MQLYNGTEMLSHVEVADLIEDSGHLRTYLVQGENGIGKTALLGTLKTRPAFRDHYFMKPVDCAQLDIGDHIVPFPDLEMGVTRGLPNERYGVNRNNQKGINGATPVVCMLDELLKSPKHIQASLAPWFYDRRLGPFEAPERSVVFATTNLGIEGLGDFMLAHTRNRVVVVTMRKPTYSEWAQNFAIPNNLAAEVIAFGEQYPMIFDSFLDYERGGANESKSLARDNPYIFNPRGGTQDGFITPRSLHTASDILKTTTHRSLNVVKAALSGAIGLAGAEALMSYVTFGRDLPPLERILLDPENCPLPDAPTAQIVLLFKLVTAVRARDEAEKVLKYVARMRDEMASLFTYTVVQNTEKVTLFVSLSLFIEMMNKHRIYFQGGV
jgi:hypothetical protein